MIRLEEIEKIPLIDTHMHRVHPARAPEWGSLGGGYIPGPGQERHGRQTVLYGMILEKLRQRFGMAEDASPEEVERERFLRYGKDPKLSSSTMLPDAPEQALDEYPMPDPMLTLDDLEKCGYRDGDMLPLSKERAMELYERDLTVYAVVDGGSAEMLFDWEELALLSVDRKRK